MICIYKCVIHYSVWQGYPSSETETGAATKQKYNKNITSCESEKVAWEQG